jgi:hypothetical protein
VVLHRTPSYDYENVAGLVVVPVPFQPTEPKAERAGLLGLRRWWL